MLPFDPRALAVLHRLEKAGHQAVLVGGCVRDSLRDVPPHDYDGATSAHPQEILAACQELRCIETGGRHGTITVLSQGLPVEITPFRREGSYTDHRHPDQVAFTPHLEEDLARRDFTINAMAWENGRVIDLFGGQPDLAAQLIRCVGDPDTRFEEDALRLLRGLRLAAQLSFRLDPATAAAIRRHTSQLSLVAWERIWGEFSRLICSPGAEAVLLAFPQVVVQILPELAPAVGFDQHSPYHCSDVYTHSVKALSQMPPVPALRLAALLHDCGKPATFFQDSQGVGHFYGHPDLSVSLAEQALTRLRVDSDTRSRVLALIRRHHLPVEPTPQWAGRWLSKLGEPLFFDLMALKRADALACTPRAGGTALLDQTIQAAREVLSQPHCLTLRDLAVNGRDALAAGLSGPAVGKALALLLDQVSQGILENRRSLLLQRLQEIAHT